MLGQYLSETGANTNTINIATTAIPTNVTLVVRLMPQRAASWGVKFYS